MTDKKSTPKELPPCPRCGSKSVEPNDRKAAFSGAIGVTVIGLLLALAYAPVLYLLIPASLYLFVSAALTKPSYTCLECRHRWPAA